MKWTHWNVWTNSARLVSPPTINGSFYSQFAIKIQSLCISDQFLLAATYSHVRVSRRKSITCPVNLNISIAPAFTHILWASSRLSMSIVLFSIGRLLLGYELLYGKSFTGWLPFGFISGRLATTRINSWPLALHLSCSSLLHSIGFILVKCVLKWPMHWEKE